MSSTIFQHPIDVVLQGDIFVSTLKNSTQVSPMSQNLGSLPQSLSHNVTLCRPPPLPLTCDVIYGCPLLLLGSKIWQKKQTQAQIPAYNLRPLSGCSLKKNTMSTIFQRPIDVFLQVDIFVSMPKNSRQVSPLVIGLIIIIFV